MMLGSKNILTPLIPDCSVLRTLTILKNIRNPLIFLRKMATYSCFWRVPSSEIFLQASLRQISDLLTLVSSHYGDGDPSGIPVPSTYLHEFCNRLVSIFIRFIKLLCSQRLRHHRRSLLRWIPEKHRLLHRSCPDLHPEHLLLPVLVHILLQTVSVRFPSVFLLQL